MKDLFENWRKLGEGEVIPFPTRDPEPVSPPEPAIPAEDVERIIDLEDNVARLLSDLYGNQAEIPIDVLERMEDLLLSIEDSFLQ
mgnify:FL=1|jgi:hypothetical protein|tara:strand:- start:80 stop:334 length:255 start_codon:yes stop_codon:yes gene_type:complete